MGLRDPRSFRVLRGTVRVVADDEAVRSIYVGGRPASAAVETYREGATIPPGRVTAAAAPVLVAKGVLEALGGAPGVPGATEAATALAAEAGIDLADVQGSGSGGRVTLPDVQAHLEALTAPDGEQPKEGDSA